MSTELGEVLDVLDDKRSIEVAIGTGGIRLLSTTNKIWIDYIGAEKLISLLESAMMRLNKHAEKI